MCRYYSDIYDKTNKKSYKEKHLNTRLQKSLSMSIVDNYYVKIPKFLDIDNILKKHVLDYIKKFEFYTIFFVSGNWSSIKTLLVFDKKTI